MDWNDLKDELGRMLFEKDALHIYAAFLIQLAVARTTRRTFGDWLPWAAVLALALVNEGIDLARGGEPRLMAWQLVSAAHDLINTMMLPTALMLLCRRDPSVFVQRSRSEVRMPGIADDGAA